MEVIIYYAYAIIGHNDVIKLMVIMMFYLWNASANDGATVYHGSLLAHQKSYTIKTRRAEFFATGSYQN